jgi:hypothetical protein
MAHERRLSFGSSSSETLSVHSHGLSRRGSIRNLFSGKTRVIAVLLDSNLNDFHEIIVMVPKSMTMYEFQQEALSRSNKLNLSLCKGDHYMRLDTKDGPLVILEDIVLDVVSDVKPKVWFVPAPRKDQVCCPSLRLSRGIS